MDKKENIKWEPRRDDFPDGKSKREKSFEKIEEMEQNNGIKEDSGGTET